MRPIETTSAPTSGVRKSCETEYRACIGWSGSKFMTIVSAPIDRDRANTSYPSTEACRCISISPDSS